MRRPLRAGQRAGLGKAVFLVLVATLAVAIAQNSCTAHTQCPNDAGSTRANYCDTRNLCWVCSWGQAATTGGSLVGRSCSTANDAVVSLKFESMSVLSTMLPGATCLQSEIPHSGAAAPVARILVRLSWHQPVMVAQHDPNLPNPILGMVSFSQTQTNGSYVV